MKVIYTDVLVIGGGLAGLRLAIGAKRRGHDAIILSLVPAKRSHSKAAQGGMQASLANVTKGQGDNEDVHFEDTVRGSDWGADQEVVRMFVNTSPKAVRELAAWGVPWSRVRKGDRQVVINGQKVWTSLAHEANWGFLLARTDPSAPKHEGISFFMVDMSTPGVEVRPLRELTGAPMFNEVFLTDVFIPADCLVGAENDGWRATRTSLANERVFMGSGNTLGPVENMLLDLVRDSHHAQDPSVVEAVGGLVAESYALSVLGLRLTLSSLSGGDAAGAAASVRKLLGVEHDQRVPELALLAALTAPGRRPGGVVGHHSCSPGPDHRRRYERDQSNITPSAPWACPRPYRPARGRPCDHLTRTPAREARVNLTTRPSAPRGPPPAAPSRRS